MLLEKRGRLAGNRRLTEELIKEKTAFGSFKEFAKAVNSGSASLKTRE
jgi:large subunit ribosomal protein L30